MKYLPKLMAITSLALALATLSCADTLELKDGRVLQGKYLGGTQVMLRFEVNGDVQTFPTNDIVALTFTRNSGYPSQPAQRPTSVDPGPPPQAPSAPPSATAPQFANSGGDVTLPAGQSILVRMIDTVDSSKNKVGEVFHASLETDLYANQVLVARKGTDVYGRLASSDQGGTFTGRAELQLELTKLIIDGREFPIISSDYNVQGKSRGSDSAKKVGGGAVLGAIIGGVAAGGKGAAIGAAAGGGAGAGVHVLTKGKQVKVPSETLLEFRLQQPATVTPSSR